MSEVVYSKKQINPLIKKYGINTETDTVFNSVIELFNNAPTYQVWGIKSVFSGALTLEGLQTIKAWADENKNLIKSLTKQNIVSYSTPEDIIMLLNEIEGLNMISFVKSYVNRFNTEQRHMLDGALKFGNLNGIKAHTNPRFKSWYKIFSRFDKLTENRKKKFISVCSAFHDVKALKNSLAKSTEEDYVWTKGDMLAFMENNTPNCKVVFNEGNIVIVEVPDFTSSRKLCGAGHTEWCITREESYFRNYVTDYVCPVRKQYFLFNFDKPESDEFAHIGFTIEDNKGIVNAHSSKNLSLMDEGITYHGKKMNIYNALSQFNVSMGLFINLDESKLFKWDLESVTNFVQERKNDFEIAYQKDNRIIIKTLSFKGLEMLLGHTFVNYRAFDYTNTYTCYVLMDFNLKFNDDKSVILIPYKKDAYNIDSLYAIIDAYGTTITNDKYLQSIGILMDDFLHRENVNPSILLHKLIDEGNEKGAIDLINKNGESFDVNTVFRDRVPVFSAINHKMYDLFSVIINHNTFDGTKEDGFGETLMSSLLYAYGYDGVERSEVDESNMVRMIREILDSDKFDFNVQDINLDTAINIAVEKPKMNWIVEELASNPKVNVNVINDFNRSALGNAISKNNVEAIKILGKRPDLIVRAEDKALADKMGIDLDKLISSESQTNETVINTSENEVNQETMTKFTEIFSKVFSAINE